MEFKIENIPLIETCRNGHIRSPENSTSWGSCKQCEQLKNVRRRVKIKKERKQTHCKYGHELTAENRYASGKCILCARLRGALRVIEKPEVRKEEARRWYLNNLEKKKESAKTWKLKNLDKFKEYAKTWQSENRDKTRAYTREWSAKNVEKGIARYHRRRAKKLNQFVANVDRHEIFKRDWHTCMICKKPLDMNLKWPDPMSPSIDHIIAIANGGTHEPANVQAAHLSCNISKGNRY